MPASIVLQSCALQMRRKVGVDPTTSRDRIQSITFSKMSDEASAATLLGVADAIGSVIDDPIVDVWRNDRNLVDAGE